MYNIASSPIKARQQFNDTMIGTGITPEAIEHNPIMYELMGVCSPTRKGSLGNGMEKWASQRRGVDRALYWKKVWSGTQSPVARYGGVSASASAAWKHFLLGVYRHGMLLYPLSILRVQQHRSHTRQTTLSLYEHWKRSKQHRVPLGFWWLPQCTPPLFDC